MKTRTFIGMATLVATATFCLTACDKSAPQADKAEKTETAAAAPETKIAFVEVDSLMSQYNFCKDYSLILQKKGQNIQNTLAQKQQQLQTAGTNFQQKLQQNAYTQEQAQSIQAGLQKQAADLEALNQRLSTEFQTETEKYNVALRDSLQHFLAVYNKDKKYSMILSKAGDNILYADKSYDITNEVIAGLNKAYKPVANTQKTKEKEEPAKKK